jgi:ATP-dependent Clp protease ATP-binding subunit ClpA
MKHLQGLEGYLKSRVLGQNDALVRISRALEAAECELNERGPRPRGSFLFMGPSGVGKTETSKAFNQYLFGNDRLSMLFMNELQSASDVAVLIAAIKRGVDTHPDGTTFLFDEIEKAHRAIIDVFISMLDEGCVTGLDGQRISVGNCYLVMTSNIGAARWASMETTLYATCERFACESARKVLRPELFNRLTEVLVYRPLSQETQISILNQMLKAKLIHVAGQLEKICFGKLSVPLSVDKSASAHLLRTGFTQTGGARRLRQELDRQLNIAVMPWMFLQRLPEKCVFGYEPKKDRLMLR